VPFIRLTGLKQGGLDTCGRCRLKDDQIMLFRILAEMQRLDIYKMLLVGCSKKYGIFMYRWSDFLRAAKYCVIQKRALHAPFSKH